MRLQKCIFVAKKGKSMNKLTKFSKIMLVLAFFFALLVAVGCKKDPTLDFEKKSFEVEEGQTFELQPIITNL